MARELWAWQGGTSEAEYLGAAAMGEDGSSVLAGHTRGNWSGTNAGGLDWAAVKLSAEGEEVWRWQSGSASDDKFHSIFMHHDGSVYFAGTTANTTSGTDFAVVHLDSEGRELWVFQDSTDGRDIAHSVAVGNDGRVVVAGHTAGDWVNTSAGLYDFAAFGLDTDGSLLWKYQDGTDGDDWLYCVAVHDDNTIAVVGYTDGSFGADNAGRDDVVAIKLSESGQELWRFQAGGTETDRHNEVIIGDDGSIILAGSTQGGWLEGSEFGQEDFAAAKLSANGKELWRYQGGTTEADEVFGATVTEDGSVILSGTTDGSWNGDNAGAVDLVLVKLSPEGEELWRWQGGTTGDDIAWAMGTNHLADGRMVLAGYSDGDWTGGGTIDGSDDFLVVMVNTTAVPGAPTTVTTTDLSSSSSATTAVTAGVVAVAAFCLVAFCLLIKRRRDRSKFSVFEEAKADFERGAPTASGSRSPAVRSPISLGRPPHYPRRRSERGGPFTDDSKVASRRRHPGVGGVVGSNHTNSSSKPREYDPDPSPPPPAHILRRESTRARSLSGSWRGQPGSATAAVAPTAAPAADAAQSKADISTSRRASEKEEEEEAAEGTGLKQPFDGVGIALSVVEGALTLAEQCPIPGVREAAHMVSMLVNMAVDSRGNAGGGEARVKMCRSVLMTLQRAAEVVGEGEDTAGETERVLIEDVHDAISDLVELIKTYESKNKMGKVLGSSLFKKRQEEADAIIDRAIMRLHLGLQVQVGSKLQQVGEDVKKGIGMRGRPAVSEPDSKLLADERRARRRRKLNQLEIPEEQVVITDELLGRGGFGAVYLANYNCRNAAVKVMQITHELGRMGSLDVSEAGSVASSRKRTPRKRREGRQRKAFLRELNAMIRLRSPNTVNVYGAITSRRDRLVLVMELLAGGDLRMFLKNARSRPLPEEVARRIITDVCAGMVFLHGKATVHGDLKSANVLLDGAGRAKIGDFGTSRWTHRGGEDSTGLVTCTARTKPNATQMSLAWSAPEVLEAEGCTFASDVYSFGVVVWEVLTREAPWADKARPRDIICAVLKGLRPTMPADAPADIAGMARGCWSGVPGDRPSFKEIMEGMRAAGET